VPAIEDLGAKDFLWGINLSILDIALVARRENKHLFLAGELAQVVVDVASLVKVVGGLSPCGSAAKSIADAEPASPSTTM